MSRLQCRFQVDRGDFALDVDLDLPAAGISALFGPSGSGKTTCLRAIAGLERLPDSYVSVGGEIWQDESQGIFVPTHRREIGYVFQEASLFAHLNVEQNLNFGQRRVRQRKNAISSDEIIQLLGIGHLLQRRPQALSGGERQRVAIARALLTSPKLLLMDEPLSALDGALKQEILPYLEQLHQALSIPVVYVSHATDEVARLADYLCMLAQGQVMTSGLIHEVMVDSRAATLFADGASSLLQGQVVWQNLDERLTGISLGPQTLRITQRAMAEGTKLRCRVYASDVSLSLSESQDSSILNIFRAKVLRLDEAPLGGEVLVTVQLAEGHQQEGQKLLAQISHHSMRRLNIETSKEVWVQIKSVAVL